MPGGGLVKFSSRQHAVDAYRNAYGRYLRETPSREDQYLMLRKGIDLVDLPPHVVTLYEHSDRAWKRFLNDIIKASLAGQD